MVAMVYLGNQEHPGNKDHQEKMGPPGANGTRGPKGSPGSPGPAGPRGAGNFTSCVHRTSLTYAAKGQSAVSNVSIKEIAVRIVHIVYVVSFPFAVNSFNLKYIYIYIYIYIYRT